MSHRGAIPLFLAFAVLSLTGSAQSSSVDRTSGAIAGLKGHILFTRAGGAYGDETLFVAKADGTRQRRISKFGGACCPWATRDGSRIVVSHEARDGRVTALTARLNGTNRVVLPLPAGTLNLAAGPFSPDGSLLAREGFDESHPESAGIYLTRASDGAMVRRVTQTPFIPGDFAPNGEQLLLFGGPEGDPPPPGSLWLVNADGTGLLRLTPATVKVECCNNYRWSPDGRKILFGDFGGRLWTIAPDGSELKRVFKDRHGPVRNHPDLVTERREDYVRARPDPKPVRASAEWPLREPQRRSRSDQGRRW